MGLGQGRIQLVGDLGPGADLADGRPGASIRFVSFTSLRTKKYLMTWFKCLVGGPVGGRPGARAQTPWNPPKFGSGLGRVFLSGARAKISAANI